MLKTLLILFVGFLIVSAGFLILLADAIRKSADSLIVSARRRVGLFALSLSCADLWPSWEGKVGISLMFLAHERARIRRRSTNQYQFSDPSDPSDLSESSRSSLSKQRLVRDCPY